MPGSLLEPYVAADFSPEEFRSRLHAVRGEMRERGLSGLLVVGPENVYYLSGLNHQGYFSLTLLVLPLDGPLMLVARAMERATLSTQAPDCVHMPYDDDEDPAEVAVRAIDIVTSPGAAVGVELAANFLPAGAWERIRAARPNLEWVDASGLVVDIRATKSPAELVFVRHAAKISDLAVQAGMAVARSGSTERAVAAAIYHEMILAGSEHAGFAPLIRATDILQHEHVTWGDRTLRAGTGLLMELSASVYRYHAPITRMVLLGEVSSGTRAAAEVALAGLEAICRALKPGARAGDVYAAWKQTVDEGLGHARYYRHHCGYAVGIGFPPSWIGGSTLVGLRPGSDLVIREGMVFHLLSWLLGQQPGDYCISDTALITTEGCELLTTTPREPLAVP